MTLKNRWDHIVELMSEYGGQAWHDRYFNVRTYGGNLRALLFLIPMTYLMWNFSEFLAWFHQVIGIPYEIDRAQQHWGRIWTVIIGGAGYSVTVFAMIMIPINRRRVQGGTSTADLQTITADQAPTDVAQDGALQGEVKQVLAEPSPPPLADWTDTPQEPVGIAPSPESRPSQRFGNTRLEMKDGKATLTVTRKGD